MTKKSSLKSKITIVDIADNDPTTEVKELVEEGKEAEVTPIEAAKEEVPPLEVKTQEDVKEEVKPIEKVKPIEEGT